MKWILFQARSIQKLRTQIVNVMAELIETINLEFAVYAVESFIERRSLSAIVESKYIVVIRENEEVPLIKLINLGM